MEFDNRETDTPLLLETPEEAARAIASALRFLRDEATAIGMRDVGILIGLACARTSDYCAPPAGSPEHH